MEDKWYEEFGAPTRNPKVFKKWGDWKAGQRSRARISKKMKLTSPDEKTIIEIQAEDGIDNICVHESPEECRIIADPSRALARIVIENLWHKGWKVE